MRINVLEPKIFNKIAAGEVVERPASIVKELVENCIDAGATHIIVEIENGGIDKIRVTDNGCGIEFDDLKKAFLPHATSKVYDEKDLVGIKTLGFRGEALASIGAVSEVILVSKTASADFGGSIEICGGDINEPSVCGADNGTDITVKNLFYNVPARAKFLKKSKTEEGEITNLVERFILANPCVSIKYVVDGKIVYKSSGKNIEDAIYEVYGSTYIDNIIYTEKDFGKLKVYGYIGKPTFTKPNRTYQTIILNNRYIQNQTIASAVHNAYGDFLMKKQFPFYVLYVDIDYEAVDVNVHPNKMEVRFENGNSIYINVFETINRALNGIDFTKTIETVDSAIDLSIPIPEIKNEVVIENTGSIEKVEIFKENKINNEIKSNLTNIKTFASSEELNRKSQIVEEENRKMQTVISAITINASDNLFSDGRAVGSKLFNKMQEDYENNINNAKQSSSYSVVQTNTVQDEIGEETLGIDYKVVGVAFKTYILVEYNGKLLFIDQHAGHERLLYDKFMKEVSKDGSNLTQPLLFPYILELNSLENDFLNDNIRELELLGFEIEFFGENCFKVTAVPYMLAEIDLKSFFDDVFADISAYKIKTYSETIKDKFASLACKSAVKAGDKLSDNEIIFLLKEFGAKGTKLLCPHGRPIVVEVSKNEIEKWFKRIV